MIRSTHTFAVLELSPAAFEEIASKLKAADYDHAFVEDGLIDMHGIGIQLTGTVVAEPDFFWRDSDPDDNGETPEMAMTNVRSLEVDVLRSSYAGPTRFFFRAPTLDPENDDEECFGFDTRAEADAALSDRIASLKAIGKYEE